MPKIVRPRHKLTQNDTVGNGNTSSFPTKQPRARQWCFTINNPSDTIDTYLRGVLDDAKYVFQLEEGENKTPHIQGLVVWDNARSFKSVKSLLTHDDKQPHVAICKNIKASIKYCQKDEGYIGKRNIKGFKKQIKIIDHLEGKEPYEWQQRVIDIVKGDVDPRKIIWLWEADGNRGKTTLARHLVLKHGAIIVGGKANDIRCGIATHVEKHGDVGIVVVDLARTNEQYVSYEAIENAKNACFFSGKYESSMVVYNTPHVIVFANYAPNYDALSQDRWEVINI